MQKSAIITQSNYIPWKGYFDSLHKTDVFVVYDDMQYTKRDWRNRNLIKTPNGLKWLTIPVEVKGKYFQKIKDTRIAENGWNISHWDTIKQNYKQAPAFKEMGPIIEEWFKTCEYEYLTEVNLHFINHINSYLGIKTEIRDSSEFILAEEKTERLVNICKALEIKEYYSGPAAKAYMDEMQFAKAGIQVMYWDYSNYPVYEQLYPPFEHGVSIIDLLLHQGSNAVNYLKP